MIGIKRSPPTAALLSEIPSSAALSNEIASTQAPPSQTSTASTTISSTISAVTTRNSTAQVLTTTTPIPPSSEVCATDPSYLCPNQVKTPVTCCQGEYLQEYEYYEIVKSKEKNLKFILVQNYCCASEPVF
jgi:hypothetical protein